MKTQSRRAILTHLVAGGIAATIAGPAAPATAADIDPVFGLIEAHREATARHGAALREQEQRELAGHPKAWDIAIEPCHADVRAWRKLVNTTPQTFAGLQAWFSYLNEVRVTEGWMLEDQAAAIVKTAARALGNLAVSS